MKVYCFKIATKQYIRSYPLEESSLHRQRLRKGSTSDQKNANKKGSDLLGVPIENRIRDPLESLQ